MTTVTGVGPALALDGPLPVARRFSLLKTPGIVKEEVPEIGPRPDWMMGVNVWGFPAGVPLNWEPCSVGTFRVKETSAVDGETDPQPQDRFDPFAAYFPLACSAFSAHTDAFAARAKLVLNATLSHAVERGIAGGVDQSNNPFFGDTNLVVLATNVSPRVGLAYLENAIGQFTGRQGMIHATPAVVSSWGYGSEFVQQQGDIISEDPPDAVIYSRVGTPVIEGSGYIGVHPVGQTAPAATKDWVFATGPVEVRIGDGPTVTIAESLDRADNTVIVYPERFVVADWDTALQVGVLIDWSLAS